MNKHMNLFLTELADLLIKHDIEMEATDDGANYYPSISGIEFFQKAVYDSDDSDDPIREYSYYSVPKCINGNDIITILKGSNNES